MKRHASIDVDSIQEDAKAEAEKMAQKYTDVLKKQFQIQMSQQEKQVLLRGLTLDQKLKGKSFEQKLNWGSVKKMSLGQSMMKKLTEASQKRYSVADDSPVKNKLDKYFQTVDQEKAEANFKRAQTMFKKENLFDLVNIVTIT